MSRIQVELENRSYSILIEKDFSAFLNQEISYNEVLILSDSNVAPLYADVLIKLLKQKDIRAFLHVIQAGEHSKNLLSISEIYHTCIKSKLSRKSAVFALGGGVVGDMAGFVAATYMRGIDFVQIPTSLLAQIDSSVGGKVGVDFGGYKNMIGAFYQPKSVYINMSLLQSLPKRELSAGLAEVIKYGVIWDTGFFEYLEQNLENILALDRYALEKTIQRCCEIKASVVKQDEKEERLRMILNFGHTIGHAIESVSGFNLLHGECVSLGMVAALNLASDKGIFKGNKERLKDLLKCAGLPVSISGLNQQDILSAMKNDKKSDSGKIHFILPEKFGSVRITTDVTQEDITAALNSVLY